MPRNVEIKARVADLAPLRERVAAMATSGPEEIRQHDTFFRSEKGRLKLRELGDGSGELIAYDRPDQPGPKQCAYVLCPAPEPRALADVLTASLGVRGVVAKRRELFLVGQTRVHLDEVEGLGSFLELEVVLEDHQTAEDGEKIAHGLLRDLGIPESDLLSPAYIDLLEQ